MMFNYPFFPDKESQFDQTGGPALQVQLKEWEEESKQ